MHVLEQFGIVPFDYKTLEAVIGEYRFPGNKVSQMEKSGELIRLRKGLFVSAPQIHQKIISRELIANHLCGPSYVSFESALSYHNLIPERVLNTRSVTLKRARSYTTPFGNFDYITAPADYYHIGIQQEIVRNLYAFIVASPEKAICDMIVSTAGLRLQSVKAMQIYLEEELRIDLSSLGNPDFQIIRDCIETGRKKTELIQLSKLLER